MGMQKQPREETVYDNPPPQLAQEHRAAVSESTQRANNIIIVVFGSIIVLVPFSWCAAAPLCLLCIAYIYGTQSKDGEITESGNKAVLILLALIMAGMANLIFMFALKKVPF